MCNVLQMLVIAADMHLTDCRHQLGKLLHAGPPTIN